MLKFVLIMTTIVVIEAWYEGEATYQEKIAAQIFKYGNTAVIPRNSDRPLELIVGVMLNDYEFDDGKLDVYVWEAMEWDDFNIGWNPEDYGGVERVEVPRSSVWTPANDWYLLNSREVDDRVDYIPNVFVHHTGYVVLLKPVKNTVICKNDDRKSSLLTSVYNCDLRYGAWSFDKSRLNVTFRDGFEQVNVEHTRVHDNDLTSNHGGHLEDLEYKMYDSPHPFVSAHFTFDITHNEDSIF